jgi:hypothetical protein
VKSLLLWSAPTVVLILALARTAVAGEEPVDPLAILKQTLNQPGLTTVSVVDTPAGREIHYCPDNTCDIFKAATSVPQSALADFAFSYIYYASGYANLRVFVTRTGRPCSKGILERNRSGCKGDEEFELASCVLASLVRQYSIRVFEARYDEGTRSDVAVNVQSAVAVNELKRVRAWQLEQWRNHP